MLRKEWITSFYIAQPYGAKNYSNCALWVKYPKGEAQRALGGGAVAILLRTENIIAQNAIVFRSRHVLTVASLSTLDIII